MNNSPPAPGGERPAGDDGYQTFVIGQDEQRYEAVLRGVATITRQHPAGMTPLARAVDPSVLTAAFDRNTDPTRTSFTFVYEECEIKVTRDRIHVRYDGPNL